MDLIFVLFSVCDGESWVWFCLWVLMCELLVIWFNLVCGGFWMLVNCFGVENIVWFMQFLFKSVGYFMSSLIQFYIVVIGVNGFIGIYVMYILVYVGEYLVGLCRRLIKGFVYGFDLENPGDYGQVLKGVKVVVYCVVCVYGCEDKVMELVDYMKVNCDGIVDLIKQVEVVGVFKFVFFLIVVVYG